MDTPKAIIFDWGGVCCSEGEPFASQALQDAIGKHPNDICVDVKEVYLDYYRGKYTAPEFWALVLKTYNLDPAEDLAPEKLTQAYLDSYTVWQDVLDTAKKLQDKYAVALLSDLTKEMRDHIKATHNTSSYFQTEMYSCDEDAGRIKGDGPEIFHRLLKKLDVEPADALFIDNSTSKIAVAKEAGLQTMLFEGREQFFRDIAPYL